MSNIVDSMHFMEASLKYWPEDEAIAEAGSMIYYSSEMSRDELHQRIIKLRRYWAKVFEDEELMNRFTKKFNEVAFEALKIAM